MGKEMKEEKGTITTQIKGNGPIGSITAVSDNNGNVKGYVSNPQLELPLNPLNGKINVGEAVGNEGMIYIIKDIGLKEPYIGMTPIISGEIAEDFTNYFARSEQTPTVVALGVLVNKDGLKSAGGYLLTLMPDAGEEEIEKRSESLIELLNDGFELVPMKGGKVLQYFADNRGVTVLDHDLKPALRFANEESGEMIGIELILGIKKGKTEFEVI